MGKLDDLKRLTAGNVDDSLGVGRAHRPAEVSTSGTTPARWQGVTKSKGAVEIPIEKVVPDPDQPREEFDPDALARLAESLRTKGQLQPIRVRWDEGRGAYVILIGERRWRAAGVAGLPTIGAVVVEGPIDPGELLAIQVVENCLREDLKPIEQARAFRALIDRNGWTVRRVAEELSINHSAVVRAIALLDLPRSVQERVEQGGLAPSVAYEVGKLDDPTLQVEVAQAAVTESLTRSEVTELVQAVKARRPTPAARPEPIAIDLGDGTTVMVRWKKANGTGTVQALKRALKLAQGRERPEQAA